MENMNGMIIVIALLVVFIGLFAVIILNRFNTIQKEVSSNNGQLNALQQQLSNQATALNHALQSMVGLAESIKSNEKNMTYLNNNIQQFNKVLNDKKVRGVFGEAQLENIYVSIFGNNSSMYALQYHLPNNTIVDSVIRIPGSDRLLAVDAKFPLENYNKMVGCTMDSPEYIQALKAFKQDVKVKINSIAEKYIIDGVTTEYALMFIPSVSVYDTIIEYCIDCVEYAFVRHVMLVSPINLMVTVEMMSKWQRMAAQHDYADAIVDQLNALNQEFILFKTRSAQIEKDCNKLVADYHALMVTSQKLSRKFDDIANMQ